MIHRGFIAFLGAVSLLSADTLVFHNGSRLEGKFVGGDNQTIRFALGGQINTYNLSDVDSVRFSPGPNAATYGGPPAPQASGYPPVSSGPPNGAYPNAGPAAADAGQVASYPVPNGAPLPPEGGPNGPYPPQGNYPPANQSAMNTAPGGTQIPAGTQLVVRMIDPVNSDQDRLGQTFRASVDQPVVINGQTVIPRGADAVATLVNLQQSGKIEGRTSLTLDLKTLTVNGQTYNIATAGVAQESSSRGKRSAEVIGGTAALGAIIGGLAGGGRGAAIGATSGAAAGTAGQVLTSGQKVKIPSETRLTFSLQNPVTL